MKFLDFDVQDISQTFASLDWIKDFNQLLLFFNREYEVGADRIRKPANVVDFDRGQCLIGIQVLTQFYVLFKLLSQSRCKRVIAGEALTSKRREPEIGFPESFFLV